MYASYIPSREQIRSMYMYVYVNLWATLENHELKMCIQLVVCKKLHGYLCTLLHTLQKVPVTLLSRLHSSCTVNISHVKINVPGPPSSLTLHTRGGPKNEAQLWKEGLFQRMLCNVNMRGCVWPSWLQPGWRWPPLASPSWGQPHEQRWADASIE